MWGRVRMGYRMGWIVVLCWVRVVWFIWIDWVILFCYVVFLF